MADLQRTAPAMRWATLAILVTTSLASRTHSADLLCVIMLNCTSTLTLFKCKIHRDTLYSALYKFLFIIINLPDTTGRTALAKAVRPDVLNAKYHVIINATYSCHNRDPVPAKFKHITNIETCTFTILWSYHVVESSGCKHAAKHWSLLWQKHQNSSKVSMDRLIKVDKKTSVSNIIHVSYIRS